MLEEIGASSRVGLPMITRVTTPLSVTKTATTTMDSCRYSISTSTSTALAAFFTFSYVGSLYLAKAGRLSFKAPPVDVPQGEERVRVANEQWRNDPQVIRARLTAAVISTLLSCLVVLYVVYAGCGGDTVRV